MVTRIFNVLGVQASCRRTVAKAMAVAGLLFAWITASPVSALDVEGIRFGAHPDKVRVVIDLSSPVRPTIFTLADPYRIVIDLPEATFRMPAGRPAYLVDGLAGYRYGLFRSGTSRIVLDVSRALGVAAAFPVAPDTQFGHRLVIDLKPIGRQQFLAESAAQVSIRAKTLAKTKPTATAPRETGAPRPSTQSAAVARPGGVPLPLPRPRAPKGAKRHIVLDPGHGGVDPGAIGVTGIYEKTIALETARILKRQLENTGRYRVTMTRNRDIFIALRQRVKVAREVDADLFISLHADSIGDRRLRGASVYTLSETASDKEAEALARQENAADSIAGVTIADATPELAGILIDLIQRDTMNQSARFAEMLVDTLDGRVKTLKRPHRFAGFAVLKAPDVPSVLVEMGFMSNREDERLLRSTQHRERISAAIVAGVDTYFEKVRAAQRQ